jgi:carboxylesterase
MHPLAATLRLAGNKPDAVLMLHGWTGSPAHFGLAASFVNERGYAVLVPRLAGHGTSVHDMAATGWRDWVESAVEGLLELRTEHERVHVVGLSMGGIIGLLLAASGDVASITTINSPQRLHSRRAWMAWLYRGSRRIREGARDQVPPGEAAHYWVQYADSPIGTVPDLLDLVDAARAVLPRVTVPALVIQSRTDETVHPESGEIIYQGLGSVEKRIMWLQRSRHVALLDSERDLIHQAILQHVGDASEWRRRD